MLKQGPRYTLNMQFFSVECEINLEGFHWRINLLAMDFFFQILAHPVFKMWVI